MVAWCDGFAGHLSLEPDDVGDARVGGRHDGQRQEVLRYHDGQRVPVAPARRRPLLLAVVWRWLVQLFGRRTSDSRGRGFDSQSR